GAPYDLAGNPGHRALARLVAVEVFLAIGDEIDPVPGACQVEDKAGAALLAIGHHIEAELRLLLQADTRGIVERLAQQRAVEAEFQARAFAGVGQPAGAREAA